MKTIVVVDDEYDIAEAVQSLLAGEGFEVKLYQDGASALSALSDGEHPAVNLFLVDVMMPRMDGIRLASEVRQLPAYQDVPVVLMSALSPRQKSGEKPAWNAFLQKPFAFGTLMRVVERMIGRP